MTPEKTYLYIAFFDLDRTILSINSANYLVKESLQRKMMTRQQYWHAIYLSILYWLEWRDTTRILHKMLSWLDGLSRERVEKLCRDVWENTLTHMVRPEILNEFDFHRRHQGAVVLLSSATNFICDPVALDLEMDDVICSHIGARGDLLTGVPVGRLVFGREKKHRLLTYCMEKGYDPKEAWYYGDSISDQHVLDVVGNPVCVEPDKKLRRLAKKNSWKIICDD